MAVYTLCTVSMAVGAGVDVRDLRGDLVGEASEGGNVLGWLRVDTIAESRVRFLCGRTQAGEQCKEQRVEQSARDGECAMHEERRRVGYLDITVQ